MARAKAVGDERVDSFYPSLYLNLGQSYEALGLRLGKEQKAGLAWVNPLGDGYPSCLEDRCALLDIAQGNSFIRRAGDDQDGASLDICLLQVRSFDPVIFSPHGWGRGCCLKKAHIKSVAEISWVGASPKIEPRRPPGQACPPSLMV